MEKSHESGLATHIGPGSCGAAREGGVEALTGERAGRVFSRVRNSLRDADAVGVCGRLHRVHRNREVHQNPSQNRASGCKRWCVGTSGISHEQPGAGSFLDSKWDGSGIARCRGVARTDASSGIACGASSPAGCLCLPSVIPIPCAAWALSPKARAGCGKSACPDPWRGL
jgi:hypothetical protein